MLSLVTLSLLAGAYAHSGLNNIIIDGTSYPPFDSRIDNLIGPVRRIEWSHDVVLTPFNPVGDINSPALACQLNGKAPALKAVARAGAEVTFQWSKIVRMHQGPILTYMGRWSPGMTAQEIKFFKIQEAGFNAEKNRWANEMASDNKDSYSVQIPSDIAPGTYVLRTELIALHGNMKGLKVEGLKGPEYYPYCFNVEVIGGGSVEPEGVSFPGAYKLTDYGLAFNPYYGNGSGLEQNSKYSPPGPPRYAGKYEKPTGPAPVVEETGAYKGELDTKYRDLVSRLTVANEKSVDYVNERWPDPKTFDGFFGEVMKLNEFRTAIMPEINAFKAASQSSTYRRFRRN